MVYYIWLGLLRQGFNRGFLFFGDFFRRLCAKSSSKGNNVSEMVQSLRDLVSEIFHFGDFSYMRFFFGDFSFRRFFLYEILFRRFFISEIFPI